MLDLAVPLGILLIGFVAGYGTRSLVSMYHRTQARRGVYY